MAFGAWFGWQAQRWESMHTCRSLLLVFSLSPFYLSVSIISLALFLSFSVSKLLSSTLYSLIPTSLSCSSSVSVSTHLSLSLFQPMCLSPYVLTYQLCSICLSLSRFLFISTFLSNSLSAFLCGWVCVCECMCKGGFFQYAV